MANTKTNGIELRQPIETNQTTILENALKLLHDQGDAYFFDNDGFLTINRFDADSMSSETIHLTRLEDALQASRAKFEKLDTYASEETILEHVSKMELDAERAEFLALYYERRASTLKLKAQQIQTLSSKKRRSINRARAIRFLKTLFRKTT